MTETWVQTVVDETWSQTVLVEEWTFTAYPSVSWEILTGTVTIDQNGGGVSLASSAPADVGTTAAVGTGTTAARSDHVHRVVTNTPSGLVRLNTEGTIPPILIDESIARDTEVTAAISAHAGASDPHGDRSFTTSAVSTHASATDPHGDRAYTDTAVSGLVPTSRTLAGLDLSTNRDAAALRTALGLVLGTDVQAYSAELAAIALLTGTTFGRSLLALADVAALRTTLAQSAVVLSDTVLGSAQSTIGGSWSGDYDDIRLVLIGRCSVAAGTATVTIQFNGDTGSNYYNTAGTGATSLTAGIIAGSQTNTDRTGRIDANISNMAARHTFTSTYLAANSTSNASSSGTGNGTYSSTSRITSVSMACGASTFAAGTRLIVVGRQ